MIRDVLEMAERLATIKATIRETLPPEEAEAVIHEGGMRSIYTSTKADKALEDAFHEALTSKGTKTIRKRSTEE